MNEQTMITINPPLPCATLIAVQQRCGQPAKVASAWKMHGGTWQIQPICERCAATQAKVYGVNRVTDDE